MTLLGTCSYTFTAVQYMTCMHLSGVNELHMCMSTHMSHTASKGDKQLVHCDTNICGEPLTPGDNGL